MKTQKKRIGCWGRWSRLVRVSDMLVLIKRARPDHGAPLSQLQAIKGNKATNEAIADWHYWVAQGYSF